MPALLPHIEDYLYGLTAAKRSDHTLDGYRNDLIGVARRLAAELHGAGATPEQLDVDELDKRAMRAAFASWAKDHNEGSLVRAWGVWDRFFRFLIDDEVLERNPMSSVPKPKLPVTAPKAIKHQEPAVALLEAAATPDPRAKRTKRWPERDVALVATFCVTGIRLAEGVKLNLDSVTGPTGERRLEVKGKGKRERSVPIEPALELLIDRYLEGRAERHGAETLEVPGAPLFVHYDGTRLTNARVQYVIERLYARAGLRSAVPDGALVHALRHSFATAAIENGTDVAELRDLLGHSSVSTTSRYLDSTAHRLREAVAAHPAQRALRALR